MTYPDLFIESAQRWPNGGARLSPAACGFILAEMEGLVSKYETELKEESTNDVLRRMVVAHLEGLKAITEDIRVGMTNKPE